MESPHELNELLLAMLLFLFVSAFFSFIIY